MNSKKAITLLVLVTMLMALVPVIPVHAALAPTLEETDGTPIVGIPDVKKGDQLQIVATAAGEVPSGETVEIYWDISNIVWNGVAGKANSTTADPDGTYLVWIEIPEAKAGSHYIWVKTPSASPVSIEVKVIPKTKLSASSGRPGDKIDVSTYGLSKDKDVALIMVEEAIAGVGGINAPNAWVLPGALDVVGEKVGDGDGTTKVFEGTLDNTPIQPGSLLPDADGVNAWVDDGLGALTNAGGGTGTINYVTGDYKLTYNAAPALGDVDADYTKIAETANSIYVISTSGDSNAVGTYTKTRATISSGITVDKTYYVYSMDAKNVNVNGKFIVGAVIKLSASEGAVGSVVRVDGRGFSAGAHVMYGLADDAPVTVGVSLTDGVDQWGCLIQDYPAAAGGVLVKADKTFSFNVIIPDTNDKDDFTLQVSDGVAYAEADYEVTQKSEITVTPDYGPQGSSISITGKYFTQIKDTEVVIELWDEALTVKKDDIKTVKTNSDGTFSTTARVPTQIDDTYKIVAYVDNPAPYDAAPILDAWNQDGTSTFRVGTILVLLSDSEGPAGMSVVLTGNGFSDGKKWNATFGDLDLFTDMDVTADGLLGANEFFVPQLPAGDYTISVLDVDTEILVEVDFTITATTTFEVDPPEAPSGYNVTFSGRNWSEDQTPVFEIWVYNSTDEWEITNDVQQYGNVVPVQVLTKTGLPDDGQFDAWWIIGMPGAAGDFDKGTYTMNISYGDDFFMQYTFTVGDEHASIAPRKSTFKIGDTVSFNIQHSFGNVAAPPGEINGGNVKVYDPSGNLYWTTNALATWTKSGMYYYVPIASQTSNGNPMVLLDDAPQGTWTYKWYQNNVAGGGDGSLIQEGTFTVAPADADVIAGQVEDLANQITDLQDSLSDVTGEFADVKSDIANVAAVAQQAVTAAQQAAQAVQTVAQTANQANTAAQNAADAANAAKDAANGLTTLVYGAIGAALVAALAAIVSLMQISRRIAG